MGGGEVGARRARSRAAPPSARRRARAPPPRARPPLSRHAPRQVQSSENLPSGPTRPASNSGTHVVLPVAGMTPYRPPFCEPTASMSSTAVPVGSSQKAAISRKTAPGYARSSGSMARPGSGAVGGRVAGGGDSRCRRGARSGANVRVRVARCAPRRATPALLTNRLAAHRVAAVGAARPVLQRRLAKVARHDRAQRRLARAAHRQRAVEGAHGRERERARRAFRRLRASGHDATAAHGTYCR